MTMASTWLRSKLGHCEKGLKQAGTYPNGLLQEAAPMVNAARYQLTRPLLWRPQAALEEVCDFR
jgi:hypothetical protein